jgi:hypothetical protein
MNVIKRPATAALLLLIALTTTAVAQQRRQTPSRTQPKAPVAPAPAPTFDTLIPADSYIIYGEVRGVGQLIKSNAFTDLLEPILKLSGPPKEFRSIVKWLNAHADEVMTSRLLVATWASGKDMPEVVIAIEFASAEEAAKFIAPLNEFLPSVLPPSAVEPSTESSGENSRTLKPNYHLQQAGSLVLLTPKPLTLKKLKPAGSKLLSEDVNFRAARNRLNSEPIFVFIDAKAIARQDQERQKSYEEMRRAEAERGKKDAAAVAEDAQKPEEPDGFVPELQVEPMAELVSPPASELKAAPTPDPVSTALSVLGSSFFEGQSKWPDAVGLALSFENDSFDLRALLVNDAGEKSDAVPFMPLLIPGQAFVPESPNILPADTELFVTMSLDLPQIYSVLSKPAPNSNNYTSRGNVQTVNEVVHESPFAAIEKQLKINLKDDLLPLLGSEIAIRLPLKDFNMLGLPAPGGLISGGAVPGKEQASATAAPALLISLKDKEGVRALMPRLIDSLGFKGASSLAQTERRDDTEIVSFVNLFSYAFVGNFLVLSGEPATTRHIVDSYLKHETLSSDSQFKSYTRWQPRPLHGQIYISPVLMESYKGWAEKPGAGVSDETRAFLTRFSAVAQPISYSLSNEGFGPLHELHVPKNLVLMAVAGISGESNPPPALRNERMAIGLMYTIANAEDQFKADKGNGGYGTIEQLIAAELLSKEMIENSGYKFEVTVSGDKFEVSGAPLEYGKSGSMSYFIDQTRTLRGADHNGASATSSDPQIN